MTAALGVLIGVLATVAVGHYYYQRTVRKSLGIYGLLNTFVFSGIAPDVRGKLHFIFRDREVNDLQQLIMLIANDGEKSIRDIIQPLQLQLPNNVELLDASIIYRNPQELEVHVQHNNNNKGSNIVFDFKLLNKREFFVVKLLISGRLPIASVCFSLLADDLPRLLPVKPIPHTAVQGKPPRMEWALVLLSIAVISVPVWIIWLLLQLRDRAPELFPLPWSTFQFSISAVVLLLPALIVVALFCVLGVATLGAAFFGGNFPPARNRFSLPDELRDSVYLYHPVVESPLKTSGWIDANWGDKAESAETTKSHGRKPNKDD